MIECGYMEEGKCNTCAECMSCPENNKVERYQKEDMTTEEAIIILHPDTTKEALLGYTKEDAMQLVNDACVIACGCMGKQIPKKTIIRGLGQRYCPVCGLGGANSDFCSKCGQKLEQC